MFALFIQNWYRLGAPHAHLNELILDDQSTNKLLYNGNSDKMINFNFYMFDYSLVFIRN